MWIYNYTIHNFIILYRTDPSINIKNLKSWRGLLVSNCLPKPIHPLYYKNIVKKTLKHFSKTAKYPLVKSRLLYIFRKSIFRLVFTIQFLGQVEVCKSFEANPPLLSLSLLLAIMLTSIKQGFGFPNCSIKSEREKSSQNNNAVSEYMNIICNLYIRDHFIATAWW